MTNCYKQTITKKLGKSVIKIIEEIKTISEQSKCGEIALVGGIVRDIINISSNKLTIKDLDLVIEGSAIELAKAIEARIEIKRISKLTLYKKYDTAEIIIDNLALDITSARVESYNHAGSNPTIIFSEIDRDLSRRDFTINSMAINIKNFKLLDPYNGKKDLENGILKLIHKKSIADDPTRIVRAARYSARLNLNLDSDSRAQIISTISEWPWLSIDKQRKRKPEKSMAIRLKMELFILFNESCWERALEIFSNLNGFMLLDKQIHLNKRNAYRVKKAIKLSIDPLTALILVAQNPSSLGERLQIKQSDLNSIKEVKEIEKFIGKTFKDNKYTKWTPADWSSQIESNNWSSNSIALAICKEVKIWRILFRWWRYWRFVKSPVKGDDLIKNGSPKGEYIGEELKRLRYQEIDNKYLNKSRI
tara:strand:+ start:198 stop:1457 length:1260 start_codon:yes stop_codon:yes gene_type:complete